MVEREITMEAVVNENTEEQEDAQLHNDIVMDVVTDGGVQQVTDIVANGAQVVTEAVDSRAQVVTETVDGGAQEVTEQEQAEVLDAEKSVQLFAALLLEQLSQ